MTDDDVVEREAVASEETRDTPVPAGVAGTRPGRGRAAVLSVRLAPEELEELTARARDQGVPVSTMARSLIVRGLRPAQIDVSPQLRDVVLLAVQQTVPEVLERLGRDKTA